MFFYAIHISTAPFLKYCSRTGGRRRLPFANTVGFVVTSTTRWDQQVLPQLLHQ